MPGLKCAAGVPAHVRPRLLRFDADVPSGEVAVAPALPDSIPSLRVSNAPLAGALLMVAAGRDGATIDGLPDGVKAAYPDLR